MSESDKLEIYSVAKGETVVVDSDERSEEEWRQILSEEQFRILRKKETERAFTSSYSETKESGTFRCAGCGTDLFLSEAKFDSGTGWPSFFEPVAETNVETETDRSLFMRRTEVHCQRCGGHLGHVFPDGPRPTGQRYCINGAALSFEPAGSPSEDSPTEESPPEKSPTGAPEK